MALDPTDSTAETLVAATARYSSFGGVGGDRGAIYRTTNGGATWTDPGSAGLSGENLSGIAARDNLIVVTSSTDSGGIFRSNDGGVSFVGISDADFNVGDNFTDLVEDTTDSMRLYAANPGRDGVDGPGGIYRSDDFGSTWTKITGGTINSELDELMVAANNVEMAVSPVNGRLYVAILVSGQPEAIFHTDNATDASPIWTRMDVPVLPQGVGAPITGASNTSPIVITSTGHGLSNPSRGVNFVVIDGVTGNTAANGFHRINVINGDQFELTQATGNGNYTGGGTWTLVAGPNPVPKDVEEGGAQGSIHFSITADPTDADIIYVGGDRQTQPNLIGAVNISGAIFRGDAGQPSNPNVAPSPQWDHITNEPVDFDPTGGTATNSAPHADSREMVFDASGNLIEVDDGGIYKLTSPRDNTGDWFSLIGNLAATEIHDIAYDSLSNTLIAGLQDNGTLYQPTEGATYWDILSGGDGGDVVVDTESLAGSNQSIRYTSFQNLGGFRKSIWDEAGNFVSESFPALNVLSGAPVDGAFNTPVELNNENPNRLVFVTDNGIYESFDQGENVTQISTSTRFTRTVSGNAIVYGGRSGGILNEEVIYVGDIDGNVLVRTAPGAAFISSNPSGGSTSNILDLAMDPDEFNTAFAVDFNQVFVTTNTGSSWSDITGNLVALGIDRFRTLEYVSGAIDAVVLGTANGIFASLTSSLGTWFELAAGFPNALVHDLYYDPTDDVLAAGTMGRGAWLLDNVGSRIAETIGITSLNLDASNNLVIEDTLGNFADDLTLQYDLANNRYLLTGINQTFTVDPTLSGATGDGTSQVSIPDTLIPVGSNIQFDTLAGNDLVVLDESLGAFARDIQFNAGGSSKADELSFLSNATPASITYVPSGDDTGQVAVAGGTTISFTGLEFVSTDVIADSIIVDYSNSSGSIDITPFGEASEQIQIGASNAAQFAFTPPTDLVSINASSAGLVDAKMIGAFVLGDAAFELSAEQIVLDGASIFTEGVGDVTIDATRNLLLDDNTRIETVGGTIRLTGNLTETPRSGNFEGILLDRARLKSETGDIVLEGRGGNETGGSFNRGIAVFDDSRIESTGIGPAAGDITLTGTGGDAANGNRGFQIGTNGGVVTTVDGDITITGTGGNGTAGFNQGIILFANATIQSTGTGPDAGTIRLNGLGGNGTEQDVGINLTGNGASVTSVDGDLFLNGGAGSGGGSFNIGIRLDSGSSIQSTGTGPDAATISLIGTGGDAVQSNRGIQFFGSTAPEVSSIDGDISLNGLGGNGSGGFNQGIIFFSGELRSTGSGNID
ncbi:MAG: hypothetical protein AAGJ83_03555, partial [Planctomycetota bacterium]